MSRARTSLITLGIVVSGLTLKKGETRTLDEIAAYAGCSPQRIKQIEQSALKKLRSRLGNVDVTEALQVLANC